jgi:HAD superfamily hydrolase (TIGR01509 family)
MIRAILCDMDGTLVDAFPPIVYGLNCTLAALGLPQMHEAEIRRHTGQGSGSIRALFGDRREEALALYARFHDERLYELAPLPGAEALLQWAKSMHIGVAVVTSKSQARAELQLAHLGWTPWIDAVVGLAEDRAQKPDPHTLHLACTGLGIAEAEAVMIGDGPADMQAAVRAGCTAWGLTHAFTCPELREAGASRCFASLHEVHQCLNTQIPAS